MKDLNKRLSVSLVTVFLSSFICIILWREQLLLTILYSALILIDFWKVGNKSDIIVFLVAGLAGPSAEAVAILSGAWAYTNPNLLLFPSWLPIAWGIWGVFIKRVAEYFAKNIKSGPGRI
jgi:hypothetical protein